MSQESVDVARQLIQAFNRRDLEAMTERFDSEIEWTPGGPAAVERAVYRGREEVSDGFVATWETWELFHLEEHELLIDGSKIARIEGFRTWQEALEAAGLRE